MARGKWTQSHQNVMDDFKEYMTQTMVVEQSGEYWTELVERGEELAKKYNENKFVLDLILAHINACNRRALKEKQNG